MALIGEEEIVKAKGEQAAERGVSEDCTLLALDADFGSARWWILFQKRQMRVAHLAERRVYRTSRVEAMKNAAKPEHRQERRRKTAPPDD